MAYTTLDNAVYALFPTNLAQGMTLVFGEHSECRINSFRVYAAFFFAFLST